MNFSQTKRPLFSILVLCFLLFSNQIFSQQETDIQGVWKGSLQIEFLFKIDRSSNGELTATFHTPQQDNEIEVIKNSLRFATEYYKQERTGNYTAGPAAYNVWIDALQGHKANSYGNALNAVTWAECRRFAVEYLKECKSKLPQVDDALFEDAIASYQIVSQNMDALAELFPFFVSIEMKDKALNDPVICRSAIKLLQQAKEAEISGIKSISLILEKLCTKNYRCIKY